MAMPGAHGREGFATLFSQMAPRLYRTALGILGNPHDAADALQDAGLKAFKYYNGLQTPEAAASWLTRIVINACYDHGRKRSRQVPTGLIPKGGDGPATVDSTDWELIAALQALPEEQRTTVSLRFFHDLTIGQIAVIMHVPEGTVKSRLHTALSKLRHTLTRMEKEGAQ